MGKEADMPVALSRISAQLGAISAGSGPCLQPRRNQLDHLQQVCTTSSLEDLPCRMQLILKQVVRVRAAVASCTLSRLLWETYCCTFRVHEEIIRCTHTGNTFLSAQATPVCANLLGSLLLADSPG